MHALLAPFAFGIALLIQLFITISAILALSVFSIFSASFSELFIPSYIKNNIKNSEQEVQKDIKNKYLEAMHPVKKNELIYNLIVLSGLIIGLFLIFQTFYLVGWIILLVSIYLSFRNLFLKVRYSKKAKVLLPFLKKVQEQYGDELVSKIVNDYKGKTNNWHLMYTKRFERFDEIPADLNDQIGFIYKQVIEDKDFSYLKNF
jgi:ABC-type multidrug transport system fused ATPase/permease subunit